MLEAAARRQAAPAGTTSGSGCRLHRFWLLLVHDVCAVYYAHPWAWDEIGFGGPAYPRGYMRLERRRARAVGGRRAALRVAPPPRQALASATSSPSPGDAHYGSAGAGRDALKTPLGGAFEAPPAGRALGSARCSGCDAPMRRYSRRRGGRLLHRRRRLGRRRAAAAAGAGRLQRRRPRGRPVLGHRARLGQRRGRLAQALLERPAHHRRRASAHARREQQRQGRRRRLGALGGASRRASTPRTSASTREDGVGVGLADLATRTSSPTTSCWSARCPSPARPTSRGAIRTATRTARIRWAASATCSCAAARKLGIRVGVGGPVAINCRLARRPAALHLSRLLHPGLQGGRQAEHARHAMCPTPSRHGAEIRDRLHGRAHQPRHGRPRDRRHLLRRARAASASSAPSVVIVCGYAIETPRLLLNSACPGFENGLANSSGTRRAST